MNNQDENNMGRNIYGRHFRPEDNAEQNDAETLRDKESQDLSQQRSYRSRKLLKGAAGHADISNERAEQIVPEAERIRGESASNSISDILSEVEAKQRQIHRRDSQKAELDFSSDTEERSMRKKRSDNTVSQGNAKPVKRRTRTELSSDVEVVKIPAKQKGKKKKRRKGYSLKDILKIFIPWRGDSVFEALRKIIFTCAVCVVGVCTFLISSYYLDLYQSKKEYEAMQRRLEETLNNRGFSTPTYTEDSLTGEVLEYFEYNEIADQYLSQNPDMVGYVRIRDTLVSYPVVQKKSKDINLNMNDYYLYRTFHQEKSRSGCIFMDYRNHFDEVYNHRRVADDSDNLLIYGHNMNNQTMFGSLRNYYCNPSYYMQHPVVELYSLYNLYQYKIFAVLIVDGEDFDSEYAFDLWNDMDFEDEATYYEFVNNAKKRTVISTDVDVKYGDPILSLYTCHGLHSNAKLILMCRRVRPGEDPLEGTQNAVLNDNVLYTKKYYDMGHPFKFDIDKFVPYGPES